ncbi:MAG: biotin-dependent carboxyltransferase family protein, partial [Pyrinomonadaceae bacterium]|nr:biotin-dependent carboxyltransferase family protein [Pyrinomonadaceae bacterium]
MSLKLTSNGILNTIQDLGRFGFQNFGINPNGAMDKTAVRLINILLGNDENEAVLEIHFPCPNLVFEESTTIAVGGANFGAKLNDIDIENWKTYYVEKGSTLKFSEKRFGARIYLSVKGGFETENWLESASTNLTANIGKTLKKDDLLKFKDQKPKTKNQKSKIAYSLLPFYSNFPTVRVIASAEFDNLTALSEQTLLTKSFVVSTDSNRMGYRLQGESLYLLDEISLVSSAVNFGTIQLLPDGQLIILMADHQTTGGYPRIA